MSNPQKSAFKSALDFEIRPLTLAREVIRQQQVLLSEIRSALPPAFAPQVLHCVPSGSKLTIYATSAGWAAQIRFYQRDILTKLAANGHQKISSLRVRLYPSGQAEPAPRLPQLPAADKIRLLRAQAGYAAADDALQLALTKLAATLDKRQLERQQRNVANQEKCATGPQRTGSGGRDDSAGG